MTSIYKASDDSMHEQPSVEMKFTSSHGTWESYNSTMRVIPCSRPHQWQDGKEYVEGKDYILLPNTTLPNKEHFTVASPLPSNEDELWKEVDQTLKDAINLDPYRCGKIVDYLQSRFYITRK